MSEESYSYMIWFSFIFVLLIMGIISTYSQVWVLDWSLFSVSGKLLSLVFIWDFYSLIFSFSVLFISSMIFFYAFYYMDNESSRSGFALLLSFFVGAMLLLIISPNLVTLLLGWDGLGLTSYLLVVYYSSSASSVAGMLTFLTNRFGDIFFLFSIGYMFFFFEWEMSGFKSAFVLSLFLMIAFMTKSAQVPFSSWLPAAMAAPTPVSSLVHSSTLVTAGVFMLIRFSQILLGISFFLFSVSLMTLLLAGVMANFEWDLKKLIAFSTLSQLGFMITSFSLGLVFLSFFHLITHAMFKASLFMSAGVVIHSSDNSQEFRNSFNILSMKPFLSSSIMVCLFCLGGVPLTSGFFSKDLILDGGGYFLSAFPLYIIGVFFTILYTFRFFVYSYKKLSFSKSTFFMVYEKVFFLVLPLWFLIMFALFSGFFLFESVFSVLFFLSVTGGWKIFYFSLIFFLIFMAKICMSSLMVKGLNHYFFSSMWFLSKMLTTKMSKRFFVGGGLVLMIVDGGWMEKLGPQGLFKIFTSLGQSFYRFNTFNIISFFIFFLLLCLST